MPIKYKIDVLAALKEKGYNQYEFRKRTIKNSELESDSKMLTLGEATIQKLRKNEPISFKSLGIICHLLECKVEDIIEYIPDGSSLN